MKTSRKNNVTIILRGTTDQKNLIERAAAEANGRSVNSWGIWTLTRAAEAEILAARARIEKSGCQPEKS